MTSAEKKRKSHENKLLQMSEDEKLELKAKEKDLEKQCMPKASKKEKT